MITITKIDEVYMRIDSDDISLLQNLNDFFSFFMDGYRFSPKYKARMWDGKIRLFHYLNRTLYIGLLPYVIDYCKTEEIKVNIDPKLKIETSVTPEQTKQYIDHLNLGINGKKISPRTHQYMGLYHIMKYKRALLQSPTASGKSLIAYTVTRYILDINCNNRILIVVPTISLVTQMYKDFIDYSCLNNWSVKDNVHTISAGDKKYTDKRVVISTWQSIHKLPPSYFASFKGVIFDEAHLLKGQSLQNISNKCSQAEYRIGMTGTVQNTKANILVLEGTTGKLKNLITTKQLMDKGEVAQLKIDVEFLKYPDYMCKGARQLNYQAEINAISGYKERNKVVCDMAIKQKNNTLLLFNTIAHGKLLYEYIKNNCDRTVYYIDGSTNKTEREDIRVKMEKDKDSILICSYGTTSTGISIKNLHVIIFASPSKSKVRVLQSIGRGLRLHEDKKHMLLIDVVDDLSWKKRRNYSIKHFIERQNHYNDSGFNYSIHKRNIGTDE